MDTRIIGVCGSPLKGGNTEALLNEALNAAGKVEGVTVELLPLAGLNIKDCTQCNFCLRKQDAAKYCAQDDDMTALYPKMLAADGLILATPVYLGKPTGLLTNFLDRLRAILEGKAYHLRMEDKIGGALTVAWFRNTGLETTLMNLCMAFFVQKMVPVPPDPGCGSRWGAVGLSSQQGTGKVDPAKKLGVLEDEYGLRSARSLGRNVAERARVMKLGKAAIDSGR